MVETVDARTASPEQLTILLGLRPEELSDLVAARPFPDLFTFRRALPFRVAVGLHSFDIPKLDINALSAADLMAKFAVAPATAAAIVAGRPYYAMGELRHVQGVTADLIARLSDVCQAPDLAYTDKASGRPIHLDLDPSKVIVKFAETEGEETTQLTNKFSLTRTFAKSPKSGSIQVFTLPDTEAEDDVLGRIKQQPGVDRVIPGFREGKQQRILDPEFCVVQFVDGTTSQTIDDIVSRAGLEVAERHRNPALLTLHVPAARDRPGALVSAIAFLNAQPQVKLAEPNFLGFDDLELSDTVSGAATDAAGWHLELINLTGALAHGNGSTDVIIAIVDSGVDITHPALRDGMLQRRPTDDWDFVSGAGDPTDDEGHGTFIAGILVGNGTSNIRGVCPGCRVLPLRVPISGQSNSYASRADAILYALDYVDTRRLVINLSWKMTGDVAVVREAIRTAIGRGAVVVASAGNDPDGPNQPHFPSDYDGVISVAAVGPDRRRATYSFFGDRINLAAPGGAGTGNGDPGQDMLSAALAGGVMVGSGTSFAAPHVAGVAALVLSQNAASTPAVVASILEQSALALSDSGLGHGLLNAAAAVEAALTAPSSPAAAGVSSVGPVGLAAINSGDVDALIARFGLLPLTAQLLVLRRPVASIASIQDTLGLTEAQFAVLAA